MGFGNVIGAKELLGVNIIDGGDDTGSEGFDFELESATLISSFVLDSGVFNGANCSFTSNRLPNAANGDTQCDLTTVVGQGTTSLDGTVINFLPVATCMFCTAIEDDNFQ